MKMLVPSELRIFRDVAITCFFLSLLTACNAKPSKATSGETQQPTTSQNLPNSSGEVRELTFNGFNYTDRYIDNYSVNGRGAGHLSVSGPYGGGGGDVCCFAYRGGLTPRIVTVKWQNDACKYDIKSTSGTEVFQYTHSFFKSATVEIDLPIPKNPQYLNVHFYPDGSVKVDISAKPLEPRLDLLESREDKSTYPRCPNGKKPL